MDRPIRALLPWLDHDEAIAVQLGHLPQSQDNVGPLEQRWREQQNNLAQRAPFLGGASPLINPAPPAIAPLAHAFGNRPDIQAGFGGLDWAVSYVNLSTVLSFQKNVVLEGIDDRLAGVQLNDPASLFAFCLPGPGAPVAIAATLDLDKMGATFSSLNPNLRASQIGQQGDRIGFQVILGPSYFQIVEYRNRWFIRDGYHRAYALLRAGQEEVPCIYIRARNFTETGAEASGFFSYEILYGDRPPHVRDFLDDAVSVTAQQRATRKVVRLKAEQFNVEV